MPLTATQTRAELAADAASSPSRNAEPTIVTLDLKFDGVEFDPVDLYDALADHYGNVASDKDALAGNALQFVLRDPGEQATLLTGVVGNNNAIRWIAADHGADGNDITVALVFSDANVAVTTVGVVGNAITVTLRSSDVGAGTILATAAEVIAAVRGSDAASELVTVVHEGASTGAGVVAAVAATPLAGGTDPA